MNLKNSLKYLILFFFFTVLIPSCNTEKLPDKGYQIYGSISGVKNGNVKLVKLNLVNNEAIQVDSATINNGKFILKGKVESPYLHTLIINDTLGKIHFFLENSKINILADINTLKNAKIMGSKEDSLFHSFEYDDIFDRKKGMDIMFNYPDYTFSAFTAFYQFQLYNIEIDTLDQIMKNFSKEVKRSTYYYHLDTLYNTLKRVAISQPAPNFSIPDTNGTIVHLDDFKGKYVLVDFWASWCAPCRASNPELIKVYETFKQRNFTIIGISIDKSKKRWLKAIKDDQLPWTNLSNIKGWDTVSNLYGVKAVPQNFLIDPNGIIIDKNIEPDKMIEKLNNILALQ